MTVHTPPFDQSRAASLEAITAEMIRLYGLPDRFLGRAVLGLARSAIEAYPALGGDAGRTGYEGLLIRAVLPRLALSLGETELTRSELEGARASPHPGPQLRMLVGTCLNNAAFRPLAWHPDPLLRSLSQGFANGSPITIALDRVSPPGPAAPDWVARHMREVSHARFGEPRFSAWEPAMQDWPGKDSFGFKRRPQPPAPREGDSPTP